MPNVNYEAELANALLTQIQLERDMRLMNDSYSKLMAEVQHLRGESEIHESRISSKNEVIERLHRENEGLKRSEATYRDMVRGFRDQHKRLAQFRERMKLIRDLASPFENEQVSEASVESNESNLVAQGIPVGGEIRHDREAKTACDSQNFGTIGQSAVGQRSPLGGFTCRQCGADYR